MKKIASVLIVSLLLTALAGTVLALDSHANIRADFYVYANSNEPDADAYAVFRWVERRGVWRVSGKIWNARPDTYTLSVGTAGTCEGNVEVITFATDSEGNASFRTQVNNLPDEFNIARIYKAGNTCLTELTAPEAEGYLRSRGGGNK